jgi:hypothetical protein
MFDNDRYGKNQERNVGRILTEEERMFVGI